MLVWMTHSRPSSASRRMRYSAKAYWPVILVLVYLWKNAGYTAIVYMAGIAGIDKEIFEAAQIDGAGKGKQIFSITLPMLRPTVIIMTLMSIGRRCL